MIIIFGAIVAPHCYKRIFRDKNRHGHIAVFTPDNPPALNYLPGEEVGEHTFGKIYSAVPVLPEHRGC
jgi:hypothetical protein